MDELDKPVLTETDLFEYLAYDEGLPVTRRSIKYAVRRREILPTRIGNGNFYSKRDGLDWIKSRRQPGVYRLPEGAAQ